MNKNELIKQIEELENRGVIRDLKNYSFIVQYPPPFTLPLIDQVNFLKNPELGVYIHIPFCSGPKKCDYCKYFSIPSAPEDLKDRFIESLFKEIEIYGEKTDLLQRPVPTLYFGGGTPTYLSPKQLEKLVRGVKSNFLLEENAEISCEVSPETTTKERLEILLHNGINRISVGVQDFNDDVLTYIGRRHNSEKALESIKTAREVGFERINIDLIYGLPKQTIDKWNHNLDIIENIKPSYVTTYHLRREKATPIRHFPESDFPSKEENMYMYLSGLERLTKLGYLQVAVNQFALPGFEFKDQENKWKRQSELLGLGPSAYSFNRGIVYHNLRSFYDYERLTNNKILPVWIGKKVSTKELMRRILIFGLKTSGINRQDGGLDKRLFEERFGISPEVVFGTELNRLKGLGLIKDDKNFVKLTLTGLVLSEEVCRGLYSDDVKDILNKVEDKFGRGGL